MPQIGGKNAKKTSSDSKRHFTVIMGNKEHGLYVSSTPSSAARKAITKLCTSNKGKKVEFHIREITQGSKKKTYGPYVGYIEKLKEPIELKGRVIKYKPVAKLSSKKGVKTGVMKGGGENNAKKCFHDRNTEGNIETTSLRQRPSEDSTYVKYATGKNILLHKKEPVEILEIQKDPKSGEEFGRVVRNGVFGWVRMRYILQENSDGNLVQCKLSTLAKARQLWQDSRQPTSVSASRQPFRLPEVPINMLNNTPSSRLRGEPSMTFGLDAFQPDYGKRTLLHQPASYVFPFPLEQQPVARMSAQRNNPRHNFIHGASSAQRNNPRHNFTHGASSAHRNNSRHSFTQGASSTQKYDEFYATVLQRAGDYRVEKVSDTKYIIYYPKTHRVTMDLLLLDDGTPYDITETHTY